MRDSKSRGKCSIRLGPAFKRIYQKFILKKIAIIKNYVYICNVKKTNDINNTEGYLSFGLENLKEANNNKTKDINNILDSISKTQKEILEMLEKM